MKEFEKWILYEEQMPEDEVDCIVTEVLPYHAWWEQADEAWYSYRNCERICREVVAWMPVPKPYDGGGNEA